MAIKYGLAAQYPEDDGIKEHPAVIFASRFDTKDWYAKDFGYTQGYWGGRGHYVYDPDLAHSGNSVFEYQNIKGTHKPGPIKFNVDEQDIAFLRWYRKYDVGYDFTCQVKTNGFYAKAENASPPGNPPTGYDKFSTKLQIWPGGEPKLYTYHPEQKVQSNGSSYGQSLPQNTGQPVTIQPGQWYGFEIMLKPNDADKRNGEIKLWIDGHLKAYYSNMRFRDTNDLKINLFEITAYVGGKCTAPKDQKLWDDNIVVATEYIGPMIKSEWVLIYGDMFEGFQSVVGPFDSEKEADAFGDEQNRGDWASVQIEAAE